MEHPDTLRYSELYQEFQDTLAAEMNRVASNDPARAYAMIKQLLGWGVQVFHQVRELVKEGMTYEVWYKYTYESNGYKNYTFIESDKIKELADKFQENILKLDLRDYYESVKPGFTLEIIDKIIVQQQEHYNEILNADPVEFGKFMAGYGINLAKPEA